jgi:transcriptional regulator with XRE-family HTH domain
MPLSKLQLSKLRAEPAGESGNRLQVAMDMLNLTQAQLAEQTGLAQPYISDVCRGRHSTITVDNAYRFTEFFSCSIEDLFPSKQAVA